MVQIKQKVLFNLKYIISLSVFVWIFLKYRQSIFRIFNEYFPVCI